MRLSRGLEVSPCRRYLGLLVREKGMVPMRQMMRILGAAVVLIVLSLAPSVAQAHSGHPHPASVHGGQDKTAVQADFRQSDHLAKPASLQRAQLRQAGMLPASDRNCIGDCCLSACAACCATGLASPMQFIAFPRTVMRVAFGPSRMQPDRKPESLRRPPRHFI